MFNSKFHPLRVMSGAAGKDIYNGGKGGSAPATPNFTALAKQQAQSAMDLAKYQTQANRVNQVTPYGSLTYTNTPTFDQAGYDAALSAYNASNQNYGRGGRGGRSDLTAPNRADFTKGDNWTATQTLSPAEQSILNAGEGLKTTNLANAQSLANKMANGQGGVDMSKLPSMGINPGETYSDAIMRRLNPQMAQAKQSFDAQMSNQGVMPGTQAYDNAYRNFSQGQNDLQTSAIVQGGQYGLNANNQAFNQAVQNQMLPINEISALSSGSQVQNPNYVSPSQQAGVAPADLVGAAQNQYNAQMQAYNAQQQANSGFLGGLMQLGGTLGGASMMKPV